ncbi:MAG: serine hydrolase, partial [Pseudomonadota bacterium]
MKHPLLSLLPILTLAACSEEAPEARADAAEVEEEASASLYSAEDEAGYMARFNQLLDPAAQGGRGLGGYDPLEPVAGTDGYTPLPAGETDLVTPEAIDAVDAYAGERNSQALIIWKDGKVIHNAYYGDTTPETLIISRSLAKPITALAIGRALKLGKIESLDQPVADFITEWKGDAQKEMMLVRHLLDQRSGFLPQGQSMDPESPLNRAYLHPRHDEVIINDMPLTYDPGTDYQYANATSEMVAPVIERATGMRYGTFVSQEVIQKLGGAGGQVWVNREGGTAHAGCCILLPAEDWLRMAILVLQDGVWEGEQLLPEGYVGAMRTGTDQNPYYGLGLWLPHTYLERRGFANPSIPYGKVLHSEPYLDKDMMMFDGNSNQIVYMMPSANMIVLRVGNRPPKDKEWDNTVIPNTLLRGTTFADGITPEPQPMPAG